MVSEEMDVAQILEQIKREVRERYHEGKIALAFSREEALAEVRATQWVNPHRPIAWPHWPEGVLPKIVAFLQKVVRRSLRWYINPIVEEQNRFNAAVVRALDALAQENAQLRAEIQALRAGLGDPPPADQA